MKALFFLLLLTLTTTCFAQLDTIRPPFQRYPTVPPLQLILEDSTTKFTKADLPKKKPLLLMLFSPDCDHCKQEADGIAANAERLKKIHVVLATTYPIYRMKEFAEVHKLTSLKNVVVAKDLYYLLPPFFDVRNYPFLVLYDKKGNLIRTFEGTVGIENILAAFKGSE